MRMNNADTMPDWNQLRAFQATAAKGSLSAAARQLGLTQPTLSRQVAALEAALAVTLFERVGKSLILTEAGLDLLEHARQMGAAADALALAASGRSQAIEGMVTISASDGISAFLLPAILARVRREAPLVTVEVVSSNAISDLRRREADIAVRHVRPDQPDLIARLLRDATARLYASQDWVARNGMPKCLDDLATCDFIGFDQSDRFISHLRGLGMPLTRDNFRLISENSVVVWEMMKQGLGISVMMSEMAERTPGIVAILPELPPITFPIWLVTHRELHTSRRIRVVFDILAEELGRSPATTPDRP